MPREVKSITSGGTMATVRFLYDEDYDRDYISFTVMIPDLFPECDTRAKLHEAVQAHAERCFGDWVTASMEDMIRSEDIFPGVSESEFCDVISAARYHIPITASESEVIDFATWHETYN